jgi:hypothetical protein
MREMLKNPKDMEGTTTEKVTFLGDGDIIFTLSGDKFIILHASDLDDFLEVRATQKLDGYDLRDQLAAAGVMSQEELEQRRQEQEQIWIEVRRVGLERERATLDARIKRMEAGR